MVVVERGNVLHCVKWMGIVQDGNVRGEYVRGNIPGANVRIAKRQSIEEFLLVVCSNDVSILHCFRYTTNCLAYKRLTYL